MLKFDELEIGHTYDTDEDGNCKQYILIHDSSDVYAGVYLTLEKAKWLRDNMDYIIKRFDS